MKIHFCDLCNESVPQGDLDEGRAFLRKGRVICAACDRAMSTHEAGAPVAAEANPFMPADPVIEPSLDEVVLPEAVAPEYTPPVNEPPPVLSSPAWHPAHPAHHVQVSRGGSGGVWLALLGLAFTGGAIFVLDGRIQDSERRAAETTRALDDRTQELAALKRRATELADGQRDVERRTLQRVAEEKSQRETLTAEMAKIQRENSSLRDQIAAVGTQISALEQKSGTGSFDLEKRFAALSARVAQNEDSARLLSEKMTAIESAPAPVVAETSPAAPAAATEAPWHLQLSGLKSDKNSTRWEAVTALGATKDPETVPYLTPMLKDSDLFVRMATARVLGDMQAKAAVPALIDALEDGESAVREAVNLALRAITNKDFKFDPMAIDAERARRVKAWRDWWKKESESPSGL